MKIYFGCLEGFASVINLVQHSLSFKKLLPFRDQGIIGKINSIVFFFIFVMVLQKFYFERKIWNISKSLLRNFASISRKIMQAEIAPFNKFTTHSKPQKLGI
jgi:hypothetical protein